MEKKRKTIVWRTQHEFDYEELKKFKLTYNDYIKPYTYKKLSNNKEVLDAGSGPGLQATFYAEYAKHVTCVDLEAINTTKEKTKKYSHKMTYIKSNIQKMNLKKKFDVVSCVGVIHHTDSPEKTFNNLAKHTKKNGCLIMWVYSKEGNFFVENFIEPLRKKFLVNSSHNTLWSISIFLNILVYFFSHFLYRFPFFRNFPYYRYFKYSRQLSFKRNAINIYDKLNCHQQYFISKDQLLDWYTINNFKKIKISDLNGVSWRVSGIKN
jgi:SAM-dependent methyltransferase